MKLELSKEEVEVLKGMVSFTDWCNYSYGLKPGNKFCDKGCQDCPLKSLKEKVDSL